MNKLVIYGSNSTLYKSVRHQLLIRADNIGCAIKEHGRYGLAYRSDDRDTCSNSIAIFFLDPQRSKDLAFQLKIARSNHNRVFFVSSLSSEHPAYRYKYVKRKIFYEFLAHSLDCSIIRAGAARAFENSISPVQRLVDAKRFADIVFNTDEFSETHLYRCYKDVHSVQSGMLIVLSSIYQLAEFVVAGRTWLLRPFDLILKLVGVTGYGYSFIRN